MFLCHEFLGSKNNVLDLHLIWLGQVSFFHRHKFVQRDPPCRAVWWNRLAAVLIADSDRFSSEYAMLNRNKVGRLLFIQSVLEDGFMFTMWFRDFYWFLSFEMCVILCVEHFGDWLRNPSQLDVKTTLQRPGRQWREKKSSILICKPQAFCTLRFHRFNDWRQMCLGLDGIQIERLGRALSMWNSRGTVSVGKRLALFDVGIGPQQNLKKPRKHSIKTPCFPMLLVSRKQSCTSSNG